VGECEKQLLAFMKESEEKFPAIQHSDIPPPLYKAADFGEQTVQGV